MYLLEPTDRICFSFTNEDEDNELIVCHAATEDVAAPVEDLAGVSPRVAPPRPARYVPAPFSAVTRLRGLRFERP